MNLDPTQDWPEVTTGQQLPVLEIPVTRTLIIATALASRDYQDVHHDPDLAVAKGSPDIFMNILTTNGLVERHLREWAGPRARLRSLKVRLGIPNHPGDTMRLTGSVDEVDPRARTVTVSFTGDNARGSHARGSAVLVFPTTEGASA